MRTKLFFVLALAVAVGGAAGCYGRAHLNPGFGRQSYAFFSKQRVHPSPATGAPSGLDSEEAAAINEGYRKQLGTSGTQMQSSPSRVMLVEPPKVIEK